MTKINQLRDVIALSAETDNPVPADHLRGAWQLATSWKDVEILATLTGREDLPADILEKAAKRIEIPIRIAYLTRKSLDRGTFLGLITAEQRAGVLAGVVDAVKISDIPELTPIIRAKLEEKPTKVLSEAILSKDGYNAEMYVTAIIAIGDSNVLTDLERCMGRRLDNIKLDIAATERLVEQDNSTRAVNRALYLLAEDGVSTKTRLLALSKTVEPYVQEIVEARTNSNTSPNRISQAITMIDRTVGRLLRVPDLQEEVLAKLNEMAQKDHELATRMGSKVTDYDPDEAAKERGQIQTDLSRASKVTSIEDFDFLMKTYSSNAQILLALINNPNASDGTKDAIFSKLANSHEEEAIEWLKINPNDKYAFCLYSGNARLVETDKFSLFSSLENGIKLCLSDPTTLASSRNHYSRWYLIDEVIDNIGNHKEYLKYVPWEYLAERCEKNSWYRKQSKVADLALVYADLQLQHLGTDMAKWETVSVISHGFSGSIEDLVLAAAAL